jgi:hypothetical protein
MTRPWIYESRGKAVVFVRPIGFYRPLETQEFHEPGHDAHSPPVMSQPDWWEYRQDPPTRAGK